LNSAREACFWSQLASSTSRALRGVLYGLGGVLDRDFRDRVWDRVWTRQLVQTRSKTYFGVTRDRFWIGFEQDVWPKLPQTRSKTIFRKTRSNILLVHESGYLKAVWPDVLGAFLRSGRLRGESLQKCRGLCPPHC
jgi:hypothetical protein